MSELYRFYQPLFKSASFFTKYSYSVVVKMEKIMTILFRIKDKVFVIILTFRENKDVLGERDDFARLV